MLIATPDEILRKGLEMGGFNHRRQQRVKRDTCLRRLLQGVVNSTQKEYQDYPLTVFRTKHIHQEVKHRKFIAQRKAMAEKKKNEKSKTKT